MARQIRIRRGGGRAVAGAAALALMVAAPAVAQTQSETTERVSVRFTGVEGNDDTYGSALSADGRFVAYTSRATNLVKGDRDRATDVFLFDRETDRAVEVSVNSRGVPGNGHSSDPAVSGDGRYVAFSSLATNLVRGDDNRVSDVFVHDRSTGRTVRVSVRSNGREANGASYDPAISADGRYVAFVTEADNLAIKGDDNDDADIFVHDLATDQTNRVSIRSNLAEANAANQSPSISGDGRVVAFTSYATNLVPGDTNKRPDVFVYDRQSRLTRRISVSTDDAQAKGPSGAPAISADGTAVAFHSDAANLVPNDTNNATDVFVRELASGATSRASVATGGVQANDMSYAPGISGDGRYVVFLSPAINLVPGDTNMTWDVFVHDRESQTTERVSLTSDGQQANGPSDARYAPDISDDGRFAAFTSRADNLVPEDTNDSYDVFVRGPLQ